MFATLPARSASRSRAPRSAALRWVALLLLAVASPCATELVLGAVATACDDTVQVTDACCPAHQAEPRPDDGEGPASPDAQRSGCGCCHSFEPTSFTPALVSPSRVLAPPVPERVTGAPVDGHRERLFRPPARG